MNFTFFGDSICFGQGISPHLTWATRVGAAISGRFGEDRVRIINTSINGNTTRLALERMPAEVQDQGVDVILIQFGLNDGNYWVTDKGGPRVSPAAFAANLAEIIDRAHRFGGTEILRNTNHITEAGGPLEIKKSPLSPRSYRDTVFEYNAIIRTAATAHGATLIDIEAAWLEAVAEGATELLLPDGLHLATRGHDLYFTVALDSCMKAAARWLACAKKQGEGGEQRERASAT